MRGVGGNAHIMDVLSIGYNTLMRRGTKHHWLSRALAAKKEKTASEGFDSSAASDESWKHMLIRISGPAPGCSS